MNNKELLNNLELIKNIKDIDVLMTTYTISELKSFYKDIVKYEEENTKKFNFLLNSALDKSKLKELWNSQNALFSFKIILLKAFIALEKKEILTQTESIANELSLFLKNNK